MVECGWTFTMGIFGIQCVKRASRIAICYCYMVTDFRPSTIFISIVYTTNKIAAMLNPFYHQEWKQGFPASHITLKVKIQWQCRSSPIFYLCMWEAVKYLGFSSKSFILYSSQKKIMLWLVSKTQYLWSIFFFGNDLYLIITFRIRFRMLYLSPES